MLVQKEFIKNLKEDFRLNIYEVKIWTSLLSKGIASAGELADISGVPRSRCYDVLESLEKKGFIIMKIGRPIKYIAVKPEEIVERVKKNIRTEEVVNINMLEEIRATDIFRELELLHKTGIEKIDSETLTDVLNGRNEIYSFMKKAVERAKKSVLIATTKDNIEPKLKLLRNAIKSLNKKGVKVRITAPVEGVSFEGVRVTPSSLNSRFVIIDNKEIIFMLSETTDKRFDSGIWVNSEVFSTALTELVNNHLKI